MTVVAVMVFAHTVHFAVQIGIFEEPHNAIQRCVLSVVHLSRIFVVVSMLKHALFLYRVAKWKPIAEACAPSPIEMFSLSSGGGVREGTGVVANRSFDPGTCLFVGAEGAVQVAEMFPSSSSSLAAKLPSLPEMTHLGAHVNHAWGARANAVFVPRSTDSAWTVAAWFENFDAVLIATRKVNVGEEILLNYLTLPWWLLPPAPWWK
jgi:hypothetical protein